MCFFQPWCCWSLWLHLRWPAVRIFSKLSGWASTFFPKQQNVASDSYFSSKPSVRSVISGVGPSSKVRYNTRSERSLFQSRSLAKGLRSSGVLTKYILIQRMGKDTGYFDMLGISRGVECFEINDKNTNGCFMAILIEDIPFDASHQAQQG